MKYNAGVGNNTRVARSVVAICFLTCAALSALVSGADAMTEARASEVAPGSYIWNPSLASDGAFSMRVDLGSQTAFVYRGETLVGIASIASGRRGYETPDGTFTVLEKERFHRSNKYDNAPMPYMQRLTWYGLALHGGHPHGHPASHGCIRMPMGFAAALFKEDTRGMTVEIEGHPGGRRQSVIASRQRTHAPAQSDDLRATEFSGGPNESSAAPAGAPSLPEPAYNGADDQNNGAYNSEMNRYADPYRDNEERINGDERREQDREPSQDVPPPDMPPPPG